MTEKNLSVPYKSQWDNDARATQDDCGPTSVAMAINYYDKTVITSDEVFEKTGAKKDQLISVGQIINAVSSYGYTAQYFVNKSLDDIKRLIDSDTLVIALVHYGDFTSRQDKNFSGGHFFLIVGYRDDGLFINDPNFWDKYRNDGDHHFYTNEEFLNGWKNCAKDGNPQNSYIVINRKPTTQSTSEVLTEQFEEYRKSAEGFYRLCDILGKPRNVDVMVSEVNQLITVEEKLQQSDKDLASFKNQLFDITEQLEQKTKDLDQLKIDNKNLQDKVDVQTRTIIELDGSIESAMDQIEELKKQADRPIGSYSGIELIVKGFVKLFGKK